MLVKMSAFDPLRTLPFIGIFGADGRVTTDEMPTRRYGWSCLAPALVLAVLVAIVVVYCFQAGYLPVRSFDAVAWRAVQRSDDATDSIWWTRSSGAES